MSTPAGFPAEQKRSGDRDLSLTANEVMAVERVNGTIAGRCIAVAVGGSEGRLVVEENSV